MRRREFLVAAGTALAVPAAGSARLPMRKGVLISMLPEKMPLADRLKLAKDVGFDDLECHTVEDPKEAEAIKVAARKRPSSAFTPS